PHRRPTAGKRPDRCHNAGSTTTRYAMPDRGVPPCGRCRSRRDRVRNRSRLANSINSGGPIEPLPHVMWRGEGAGNPGELAADRKSQAVEFRKHGKGRFISNVVPDEDGATPVERRMLHQFANSAALVEGGKLDLDDLLPRQDLDRARRVRRT